MTVERLDRLHSAAARVTGLSLLVLHGSRARGDAAASSDWDFGYAGDRVDPLALSAALATAVDTDRIDVADLDAAGGLLRFRAARDGVLVFERSPGRFDRFWLDAVGFHCDAGHVLRAGWEGVLAGLGSAVGQGTKS